MTTRQSKAEVEAWDTMRGFALFALFCILLGAVHVQQNPEVVSFKVIGFTKQLPLGLWNVVVFICGGIFMWLATCLSCHSLRRRAIAYISVQAAEYELLKSDLERLRAPSQQKQEESVSA
jgi:uncharacterized integral membrane protein